MTSTADPTCYGGDCTLKTDVTATATDTATDTATATATAHSRNCTGTDVSSKLDGSGGKRREISLGSRSQPVCGLDTSLSHIHLSKGE